MVSIPTWKYRTQYEWEHIAYWKISDVNAHVTYVFSMFMRWFFSSFELWDFIAIFSFSSDSLWAFWNSFKQLEKVFASFVSITRRWRRSDSCSGLGSAFSSLRNLSVSLHSFRVACCLCCLKTYCQKFRSQKSRVKIIAEKTKLTVGLWQKLHPSQYQYLVQVWLSLYYFVQFLWC